MYAVHQWPRTSVLGGVPEPSAFWVTQVPSVAFWEISVREAVERLATQVP